MTDWLKIASESYQSSTSYFDANYRKNIEDSIRMFNSEHPQGSKYLSEDYKHRSRLFRPKSRSIVRKNEAILASAFFSNMDIVDVQPLDESDPVQLASAQINKNLLQYRLTKTIPWFQTIIGALQSAQVVGVVCSYQSWKYREKVTKREIDTGFVDYEGNPVIESVEDVKIIDDRPDVELLPIENCRFDPSASWIDPVNTSPYFIRMIPMYVQDVKSLMESEDRKTGMPKFKKLSDDEISAAVNNLQDSTRQQREEGREDSKQGSKPVREFEIVWVHENFVRMGDEEYVYFTLMTEHMLTDPKPLEEVYFHGERPIVMGVSVIEAHKVMPDGVIALGKDLQKEANEIVNQRLDNVKLVLNKRWFVQRGKQVDLRSLVRNVPGSITLMNNVDQDVREVNFPDVTSSSYAEQDRVNVDYDELTGNFSAGSVQTNRQMNETVGGMGILASGANQMSEYLIRTFTETWVEPVLRQLIKLEQKYETDAKILALAGKKAEVYQKYGIDQITDELLNQELTTTVNVGMGATDPNTKIQKFLMGMNSFMGIASNPPPNANMEEITKEIFGHLGYRDGSRFFNKDVDPMVAQLQQQVQALTQVIQSKQMDHQMKMQERQLEVQSDQVIKDKDLQFKYEELDRETQLEVMKIINGRQERAIR